MPDLDALLEAAGLEASAGYLVTDGAEALVLDGARPVVVLWHRAELWLLAVVGLDGFEHYPEDDLAEEAGVDLTDGLVLEWQEPRERAVLARQVALTEALAPVVAAFTAAAAAVEERLVGADLGFRAVPAGEDPCDRGPLLPPA